MLFDLHVHTQLSACSCLSLDDILTHARERGLDGVCLTDHETMAISGAVREGIQVDGLCVLVGMEYTTAHGDFLLFGPCEEIPLGLGAERLLPLVDRLGAVAVAAHPCRIARPAHEDLMAAGDCRLVERINGRNAPHENSQVAHWINCYDLHACGGSDAHSLDELGRVVTCFQRPVRNRADLVRALRAGDCQAAWNPHYEVQPLVVSF